MSNIFSFFKRHTQEPLGRGLRLEVINLGVKQGSFTLSNISFGAQRGDIYGLMGRSGSGKSTLINALVGLTKTASGTVRLAVDDATIPLARNTGYSPQDHALYSNLTLRENCEIFGGLEKVSPAVIHQRMHELLKRLQLQGHENKPVRTLSGGMRKRADLLVALIHDPPLLVLDEPFTGLDVSIRKFIWELLKELARQGKIIVITTHDIADVRDYCNRFGIIYQNTLYRQQEVLASLHGDKTHLTDYVKHIFDQEAKQ